VLRIFIALAGFKPPNLGPSSKHTNHYIAKATEGIIIFWLVRSTAYLLGQRKASIDAMVG
jgi:hypothetical protein